MTAWEPVIGLEIHVQLNTQTKLFSPESTHFKSSDNENIHAVSFGLPGALPVLNQKAIEKAIKLSAALNCDIQEKSIFERKNYFYPDLPKGYQISQFRFPLARNGYVEFYEGDMARKVRIERAHIEEDAGKSTHEPEASLINFNRSGVPLLEIVTGPEIHTPMQAAGLAKMIQKISRHLDVSDGHLEEGSMRCDCNVSLRPQGSKGLGTKVELKNLNSFRFIEKALLYEITRQKDILQSGEAIVQETRLYDSAKDKTYSMRTKEESTDYRYFPEPDLPPLTLTEEEIKKIKIPELPFARQNRYQHEYSLSFEESEWLASDPEITKYFEKTIKRYDRGKRVAAWMMSDLAYHWKGGKTTPLKGPVQPNDLADLLTLIDSGVITGRMAKKVLDVMWEERVPAKEAVNRLGFKKMDNKSELQEIVMTLFKRNPAATHELMSGKKKVKGFFVGQVMKQTKGQAPPELVNKIINEELEKQRAKK